MSRLWLTVFLTAILPLLWSLEVRAVYHEPSMKTFNAPSDVSGSLFGYSIAYQPNNKKLITSAPKFGTGNIYECNIETKKCDKIEVNGTEAYKYDSMWLGATIATGHNFTMACAPRYTELRTFTSTKHGTFGRCYATSSGPIMAELPTITLEFVNTIFEKNMDSFGWSMNVDRHDSIIVGGPAMNRGRVMLYDKIDSNPKLLNTPHYNGLNVKFNFGYSVTSGNFLSGNVEDILYAISSPYGEIGHGVVIMTDLLKYWALSGPRSYKPAVGSLFGAALTSAALRGPGQRQALLVGAPRYAEKGRVDVGAVYIYQFDPAIQGIVHQKTILGRKDKGQFGSAIISLGDLNGDNRDEIAVSAPYEDSGRGAVYIYSGGHLLSDVADSMLQSLQRIQLEDYRAFGLSLTALQDYDDNGCNELAIGAPHSDKFVLLKCMAKLKVIVQNLQDQKRQNDTYFVFKSCMDFVFPKKPKIVRADILLKISISHKDAKLANADEKNNLVERKVPIRDKTPRHCVDVGIIIPKVTGYEPSIQYQITATQINSPATEAIFDPSHLLLSDLSVLNVSDTVWVADCAGAGECKPLFDLSIQATIQKNYIIGSTDIEYVSFTASNSGDVAYKACAQVDLQGVRFGRWPSSCTLKDYTLYCAPRKPVENNTIWQSEQIELDMKSLKSDTRNISVNILIYPHCQPTEKYVMSVRTFNLQPDVGLILKGVSNNTIKLTNEEIMEAGKHTSHIYTVFNNGKTVWVNLRCEIEMQPKYFYKEISVTVDSETPYLCETVSTKNGLYTTTCVITKLRKYHKFDVIIPIFIEPGTIDTDDLNDDNTDKLTVSSHFKLIYDNNQQKMSIVRALKLKEAVVPVWIVVIAALVGLLIIIIIAFALYECGFLRRKNRDKLKRLRRSVHRQSVRRSMALRESMRASAATERRSGDREKLIGKNDTDNEKMNTDLAEKDRDMPIKGTEILKNDIEDTGIPKKNADPLKIHTKKPENGTELPKVDTVPLNISTELPKNESNLQNEDNGQPKKVADTCKNLKNDHIIRGLQKNLVQNRSMTHLAVTPKDVKNDAPLDTEI